MKHSRRYKRLAKFSFIATLVAFLAYASVGLAALTFNATTITSDGALTVDSSGIMEIASSTATIVTIGRSGQTVRFPGVVSSSIIEASGVLQIGTSTAGQIIIGRSGQTVSFPGAVSSSIIEASGVLQIGTSTATTITIGRSGQLVQFPGNASTSGSFAISATGTPIIAHLSGTATVGFGTVATSTCQVTPITVTGASEGDTVYAGVGAASTTVNGFLWSAYVSSTNTVAVRGCNVTLSNITVPSSTWRADVWKH